MTSLRFVILVFSTHQLLRLSLKQRQKWFGHKSNGFGLKYEIATCIRTGDIVHYVGPFRAAIHDIAVYRSFLKGMLRPGEKVMADRGFRGDDTVVTPLNATNSQESRAIHAIGLRHETVNGRLCFFESMKQTWRHDLRKHQLAFRACLVMVQLRHENGFPVFQIYGYGTENIPFDSHAAVTEDTLR
jgi:DDE superfamily endonuclease